MLHPQIAATIVISSGYSQAASYRCITRWAAVDGTGFVLELKRRVPVYQDKQGSWHHTDHSKAHDKVAAVHYTQVQLQLLVTGKPGYVWFQAVVLQQG